MRAKSLHSCPPLPKPMDCGPQAPLSREFFKQEYWSGLPFPPPKDLPDSRIGPAFPVSPALAGRFFTTEPPGKLNKAVALGNHWHL